MKFLNWLYESIGMQVPRTEPVFFHCDSCHKTVSVEQLHARQNHKGLIQKLCDNCI
jgi:hypothetical protein